MLALQSLKYVLAGFEFAHLPSWQNDTLRSGHEERRVTPKTNYANSKERRMVDIGLETQGVIQVNTQVEQLVSRTLTCTKDYLREAMLGSISDHAFREAHDAFLNR